MITAKKYWRGSSIGEHDDFGDRILNEFIDGATIYGSWAIMTIKSWRRYSRGQLGTGWGQRYRKQSDGRWLKVEG